MRERETEGMSREGQHKLSRQVLNRKDRVASGLDTDTMESTGFELLNPDSPLATMDQFTMTSSAPGTLARDQPWACCFWDPEVCATCSIVPILCLISVTRT